MNAVAERPLRIIADADYDRRKFIGSSNVAAIMGSSPEINGEIYTALDVWEAKVGDQPEELHPRIKRFLERRKRWEPVVVQMLREDFDAEIVRVNTRYVDLDVDHFAAEIDAEAIDPEHPGEIMNVEIKTVSPRAFGERWGWGEPGDPEGLPIHYEAQVMFGLGVTRRRRAFVGALVGLDDLYFYPVEANPEAIAKVREACARFWTDHVLTRVAPEPQTIRDIEKLYKRPIPDKVVTASSELGSKALRLRAIDASIAALLSDRESLEFDVKLGMKDAEVLRLEDGRKVLSWSEQNWSRLDQDGIKTKEKEIYKRYLLSGKHRVFKVMKSLPT